MDVSNTTFAVRLAAFAFNIIAIVVDIDIICTSAKRIQQSTRWTYQHVLCLCAGVSALLHASFMIVGKLVFYLGTDLYIFAIMWDVFFYSTLAFTGLAYLDRFQRLQINTLTPNQHRGIRVVMVLNVVMALMAVVLGIANTMMHQRLGLAITLVSTVYAAMGVVSDFYLNLRLISVTLENSQASTMMESDVSLRQPMTPLTPFHFPHSISQHPSLGSMTPSSPCALIPSSPLSAPCSSDVQRRMRKVTQLKMTMLTYFILLMMTYLLLVVLTLLGKSILGEYENEIVHIGGVFTSFHCWISLKLLGIFLVALKALNKKPAMSSIAPPPMSPAAPPPVHVKLSTPLVKKDSAPPSVTEEDDQYDRDYFNKVKKALDLEYGLSGTSRNFASFACAASMDNDSTAGSDVSSVNVPAPLYPNTSQFINYFEKNEMELLHADRSSDSESQDAQSTISTHSQVHTKPIPLPPTETQPDEYNQYIKDLDVSW